MLPAEKKEEEKEKMMETPQKFSNFFLGGGDPEGEETTISLLPSR